MSMKITRVHTHWTAEEAHTVIEFLDVLRDQLWHSYGDTVVELAVMCLYRSFRFIFEPVNSDIIFVFHQQYE